MFEKLSRLTRTGLRTIIIRILFTPAIKIWFDRIIWLYEAVQRKKELDMLTSQQVRLNYRHYLPNTEARIERLRRVINKRPVAILLHGPSIAELETKITKLDDCDICYFGLNSFTGVENHILQQIECNLSLIMCGGPLGLYETINNHNMIDFLERQEDNIFFSERASFHVLEAEGFNVDKFIKKHDKKLLFYKSVPAVSITTQTGMEPLFLLVPSVEYPLHFLRQSSLSLMLSLALIGEAPMVAVFGADGGGISGQELYYRETGSHDAPEESLTWDTERFNLVMPLMLEKIYKMYNLRPVDIINCSVQSHYTPLRKLSYDETFALLKSFKRDTG